MFPSTPPSGGFHSHVGTPSHHPFQMGFSMKSTNHRLGTPMTMETPHIIIIINHYQPLYLINHYKKPLVFMDDNWGVPPWLPRGRNPHLFQQPPPTDGWRLHVCELQSVHRLPGKQPEAISDRSPKIIFPPTPGTFTNTSTTCWQTIVDVPFIVDFPGKQWAMFHRFMWFKTSLLSLKWPKIGEAKHLQVVWRSPRGLLQALSKNGRFFTCRIGDSFRRLPHAKYGGVQKLGYPEKPSFFFIGFSTRKTIHMFQQPGSRDCL